MNFLGYGFLVRSRRLKPVIVDPGLYLVEKTDMFFASQKRELPKAFKLFSGHITFYSSFLILCVSSFIGTSLITLFVGAVSLIA